MNTELNNNSRQGVEKSLMPRTKRMRLFLATYTLGAIVVFFMGPPLQKLNSFSADQDFPFILEYILFLIPGTFFFLPMGVVLPFIHYSSGVPSSLQPLLNSLPVLLLGLSYILTLLLPLFGSSTEKPRTFRRLYLFFIGLLVTNVAGCITNPVPIH